MKKASGFTLIELLVVISIIATLAAVLTPNVAQARARANDAAVQAFTRQVVTAVEVYLTDNVYNKAFDLTGGNSGAGAQQGPCAYGPVANSSPVRPKAYTQNDEYYNLANYGVPFPFPQAVKAEDDSIIKPSYKSKPETNGCYIVYDGRGGYGVAAQSITNNVQTLYNGQICNWKANDDGSKLQEQMQTDPKTWASSSACGGK